MEENDKRQHDENCDKFAHFCERRPTHEFKPSVSRDGKYFILRYITTWIVPVNYLKKIETTAAEDRASAENGGKTRDRSS